MFRCENRSRYRYWFQRVFFSTSLGCFFVFLVFFQSTMKMECSLYLCRSLKTLNHFVEMVNTADIHCCYRPWYTQMVMIIIKSIFVQNNVNKCSNFSQQSQNYYHFYLGRVKKIFGTFGIVIQNIYECFKKKKTSTKSAYNSCVYNSAKVNQAKRSVFRNLNRIEEFFLLLPNKSTIQMLLQHRDYDYLISFSWNP